MFHHARAQLGALTVTALLALASPLAAAPEMVRAFAFTHWPVDCPTQSKPGVKYTLVRHEFNSQVSVDFLKYDAARGWGYEVLYPDPANQPYVNAGLGVFHVFGPFDNSPNNRNLYPDTCPAQLYDSFIGAKNFLQQPCDATVVGNPDDPCTAGGLRPEGIIFRVDVPNGLYRFVGAVGSPDNPHAHRILAEDGGEGPPELIGDNHVVLISNHDEAQYGAGNFARIGFSCFGPPTPAAGPRFTNMDADGLATDGPPDSPTLEVTQGYIRIHQLQANSNNGVVGRDPNGGDLVLLELWKVDAEVGVPPQVARAVNPDAYNPGDAITVTLTVTGVSGPTTIVENLPPCWSAANASSGGVLAGTTITWIIAQDATLSYTLIPCPDVDVQLSGTVEALVAGCDLFKGTIGGESAIDRIPPPENAPLAIGTAQSIGFPLAPGSQEQVSADPLNINLWSSGVDIWGTADEGRMVDFGDFDRFDIQCVVAALDPVNPWTKAGLMARSVVSDASSPYAFICATGSNGTDFQYRDDPLGMAANRGQTGGANLLRELRLLRRTGDLVEAFARKPGDARWRLLGTRDMPNLATFVGIAVTSHDLNLVAGARFEDILFTDVPPPAVAPVAGLTCAVQGGKAVLTFTPPAGATAIEVLKSGASVAVLAGDAAGYSDPAALAADALYEVVAFGAGGLPAPSVSCFLSPCHENPTAPQAELVQALVFSHWPVDCPTQNDPNVNYTVVRHEFNDQTSVDFLTYDAARGWGYEVLYPDPLDQPYASVGLFSVFGPLDNSPNNRNLYPDTCPKQLYDSFIGAKNFLQTCSAAQVGNPNDPCTAGGLRPEGIIFRVDVPNGLYRFVAAVGSPDNPHAHRILVEDGGEGLPEFIGENHVVLVSNHDQAQTGAGVYARVGFDGKIPPPVDGVAPSPRFVNMDEDGAATTGCASSPTLEVTQGYVRIHQLQGNSNNGVAARDPNGGDLVILELWKVGEPAVPPNPPRNLAAQAGDAKVDLAWEEPLPGPPLSGYRVFRDGTKVADLAADRKSYSDGGLNNDTQYCYVVRAFQGTVDSPPSNQVCATPRGGPLPVTFRRGDVNSDGKIDVTDPVKLLGYLFLGQAKPECLDAGDTDDSGVADISDAVSNLGYQFLGAGPPAAPGPINCGVDPGPEPSHLGCDKGC